MQTAGLEAKKILEHLFAVFREDGFGVKLDTMDWVFLVAQPHDLAFLGPCGDGGFHDEAERAGNEG